MHSQARQEAMNVTIDIFGPKSNILASKFGVDNYTITNGNWTFFLSGIDYILETFDQPANPTILVVDIFVRFKMIILQIVSNALFSTVKFSLE